MKMFEDLKGRTWNLSITIGSIKRVSSALDINMADLSEGGFLSVIADDPVKLVDMFWILLEDEAKNMIWKDGEKSCTGVSDTEFGEGFAGDVIDKATIAFTEELTDFFPKAKRELTRKLFAKSNSLVEMSYQEMEKKVDEISLEELMEEVAKA